MTRPLVAFYGDDLTGSTDTLSTLAEAGLSAVLFLGVPSDAERQATGLVDAVGIAGTSRTMSPQEMDEHLPTAFEALKATGAQLIHYKVCSTFDSSPAIGSIGHAIVLGRSIFRPDFVPIVVGQPGIGRYCAFGNLFAVASANSPVLRLDRHPTMSRHPVTPMGEADLRIVLAKQRVENVALIDLLRLRNKNAAGPHLGRVLSEKPDCVLFDVLDDQDLQVIGELIGAKLESGGPVFGVGSSGLQQALIAGWKALAPRSKLRRTGQFDIKAGPVFVISGSRSPVAAAQIEAATRDGFSSLALDPRRLVDPVAAAPYVEESAQYVASRLRLGQSVIAHTSLGPDDPRGLVDQRREILDRLAHASGKLLDAILTRASIGKVGIAGGDTSGTAARALGVRALEFTYRLAPGVPVCTVRGSGARLDGLQIMLKGGQMGPIDLFHLLASGASRKNV